jgi:hypothetical protein
VEVPEVRVPRGSVCLVAVVSAWRSVCAHVCVCVCMCAHGCYRVSCQRLTLWGAVTRCADGSTSATRPRPLV